MTKMLKPDEVARILDIPKPQVYKLAKAGLLPSVRCGRLWRFDADDLADWMRRGGAGGWKLSDIA